jgi:hypothetical protein
MSNQGPGRGKPSDGTSASAMLPARTRSHSPTHASNLLGGVSETQLQVPILDRALSCLHRPPTVAEVRKVDARLYILRIRMIRPIF